MKKGKNKNAKCKIRGSYGRTSYTLARVLCFILLMLILGKPNSRKKPNNMGKKELVD